MSKVVPLPLQVTPLFVLLTPIQSWQANVVGVTASWKPVMNCLLTLTGLTGPIAGDVQLTSRRASSPLA